jgi:hypothetical protein
MVKKTNRRKKDLYWHKTAELCLQYNLKPAQIAKVIKDIFPQCEVNGRHIGAYKRRLLTEGNLDMVDISVKCPVNEMMSMARDNVLPEDEYIYKCAVGSHKRSLKCFEYKLTAEEEDELDKVERWINEMKKK